MLIHWTPEFEIGIEKIDQQHKQIVDMINELHHGMTHEDSVAAIRNVMVQMVKYTQEHFAYEEALMEKLGYPGLEKQRSNHKVMVDKVRTVLMKLKAGEPISARQLMGFLQQWWTEHIQKDDMKIGPWVKSYGKKAVGQES